MPMRQVGRSKRSQGIQEPDKIQNFITGVQKKKKNGAESQQKKYPRRNELESMFPNMKKILGRDGTASCIRPFSDNNKQQR